jgi:hypothetical protein
LAASKPALVLSLMISRSNSARGGKNVKSKTAGGRSGIDVILEANKFYSPVFKVCYQVDQIPQGTAQPVQLPNHDRITGTELTQHLFKFGPVCSLPGFLFYKDEPTGSTHPFVIPASGPGCLPGRILLSFLSHECRLKNSKKHLIYELKE